MANPHQKSGERVCRSEECLCIKQFALQRSCLLLQRLDFHVLAFHGPPHANVNRLPQQHRVSRWGDKVQHVARTLRQTRYTPTGEQGRSTWE